MGFKKTTRSLDFADLAMANCLEQNRSIKLMEQLNNTINWARVESILLSHYTVGTTLKAGCHQRGQRNENYSGMDRGFQTSRFLKIGHGHLGDELLFILIRLSADSKVAGFSRCVVYTSPTPGKRRFGTTRRRCLIPSTRSICGLQPSPDRRDTSSSFWGMPSGRDESQVTSPSNPTAFLMIAASSRIVLSLPQPTLR